MNGPSSPRGAACACNSWKRPFTGKRRGPSPASASFSSSSLSLRTGAYRHALAPTPPTVELAPMAGGEAGRAGHRIMLARRGEGRGLAVTSQADQGGTARAGRGGGAGRVGGVGAAEARVGAEGLDACEVAAVHCTPGGSASGRGGAGVSAGRGAAVTLAAPRKTASVTVVQRM